VLEQRCLSPTVYIMENILAALKVEDALLLYPKCYIVMNSNVVNDDEAPVGLCYFTARQMQTESDDVTVCSRGR